MDMKGTTIIAVRKDGKLAMAGDGQVTLGSTIFKGTARKVLKIKDSVLVGFAGSTADAFTLLDRFEEHLVRYKWDVRRSCIEFSKEWRSSRVLQKLEAMLLVGNPENLFVLSGNGDVIDPEDDVVAIGSGGSFALSAGLAFLEANPSLSAKEIAQRALKIAAKICIYTNNHITVEEI